MKYKVKALNVGDINGRVRYHGEEVDGACFSKPDELVADGHLEPVSSEPEERFETIDPPLGTKPETPKNKKNGAAGPDKK